jgi:hypothetical protein
MPRRALWVAVLLLASARPAAAMFARFGYVTLGPK